MKAVSTARPAKIRRLQAKPKCRFANVRGLTPGKYETQADQAAQGFVRKERNLADQLSRTEPAGLFVPTSRPSMLDAQLLSELQDAFNTDLSALRIHTDNAAARTANEFSARAFASGTHIYFNQNQYDPDTNAGRTLIAHEVAHVLQQTRASSSTGKFGHAANDVAGSGIPQLWEIPLSSTENVPDIDELLRQHKANLPQVLDNTSETSDERIIDRLISGHETATLSTDASQAIATFWGQRAQHVTDNSHDPVLRLRPSELTTRIYAASALYDSLKKAARFPAAARLLNDNPAISTYFFSAETYNAFVGNFDFSSAINRIYDFWYTEDWFGRARPDDMLKRTFRYLMGPEVRLSHQLLQAGRYLDDTVTRLELDRRNNVAESKQNEIYFMAVLVANQVEQARYQLLLDAANLTIGELPNSLQNRAKYKHQLVYRVDRKLRDADRSRAQRFEEIQARGARREALNIGDIALETDFIFKRDVIPSIGQMVVVAERFWRLGAEFSDRGRVSEGIGGLSQARIIQVLNEHLPRFYEDTTTFIFNILAKNDDNTLPDPATFNSLREAEINSYINGVVSEDSQITSPGLRRLENDFLARFSSSLPTGQEGDRAFLFDAGAANAILVPEVATVVSWAFFVAQELLEQARKYNLAQDRNMVGAVRDFVPGSAPTDVRDIFRVRFARKVDRIATNAGITFWQGVAQSVLTGDEFGEDYIAFGSDWDEDENVEVGRIQSDFSNRPSETVSGLEPLGKEDLFDYLIATDYRRTAGHINRVLGNNEGTYNLTGDSVFSQAVADSRADTRPKRFVIEDYEWVHRQPTLERGRYRSHDRVSGWELVSHHALTRKKIRDTNALYPDGTFWLANMALDPVRDAIIPVLWVVPRPDNLIRRIQQIDSVNQVIIDRLRFVLDPAHQAGVENVSELLALLPAIRTALTSGTGIRTSEAGQPLVRNVVLENITIPQLKALTPKTWWDILDFVKKSLRFWDDATLLARIRTGITETTLLTELSRERETALSQLQLAQRKANSHQRRRYIETVLRPALSNYDRYSSARYRIPGDRVTIKRLLAEDVAGLLASFLLSVSDQETRNAHTALAVTELADTIHARLLTTRDLRVIRDWLPMIDIAVAWYQDPETGGNTDYRDTFVVPEEEGNTVLYDERVEKLTAVLGHMVGVLREEIREWGLVGERGDGTVENTGHVHAQERESRQFGRGSSFTIDGVTWEVLQVRENFTFHPAAFPLRSSLGRSSSPADPIMIINGQEYSHDTGREAPHVLLMYVRINDQVDPTAIYADQHQDLLARLTWATYMQSTIAQLNDLAEAMEFVAATTMDLVELFPVAGQAVAAARLVTTALLVVSSDLPNLMEDIVTNPTEVLDRIQSTLAARLTAANLISFLLFSNENILGLRGLNDRRVTRTPAGGGRSSRRWRRLARKVQNLVRGVVRIFAITQDRVQDRRQSVEHLVQNSPFITLLVTFIADHYHDILGIVDRVSQMEALPGFESFEEARTEFTPENLKTRLDDVIEGLGTFELPADIIPLEEIINTVIDIAGHRLGGKYKAGVRILIALLDAVGARERIVSAVADAIRAAVGGNLTDTLLPQWRNDIVPNMEGHVETAQVQLRNAIERLFSSFDVPLNLATPSAHIRLSGTEFPEQDPSSLEAQPSLEDEVRAGLDEQQGSTRISLAQASRLLTELPALTGEPLSDDALRDAQARFGQDFSDVRLHRDSRLTQMMESFGARALTSGSHVVMSNNIGSDRQANELLFHELTHVIQQTGERPLGRAGRRRPQLGRRRRGVRFDPHAEAQADAVAATAMRGDARAMTLSPNVTGLQPNMFELFGIQFLQQLTDISGIEEETADIDRTTTTTGTQLIGRDVRTAVAHVGARLTAIFRSTSRRNGLSVRRNMQGKFQSKYNWLRDQLQSRQTDINNAIEDIAIRASYVAERGRNGRPPTMGLDIDDFTRRLERYILGKTGILLDLTASTRGRGRAKTFRNVRTPYTRAEINFVYLPAIHGGTRIWREVVERRTRAAGAATPIPQDERGRWRRNLRAVLRDLGTSSSVWDNGFKLSWRVFDAAEELHQQNRQATVPPANLPSKAQYLTSYTNDIQPGGGLGNIRLHLGTYDQKGAQQSGTERESHHITQYLLIEYFHNGHDGTRTDQDKSGFPLLHQAHDAYPGLTTDASGKPVEFRNSPKNMKIDELNQGRGGKMPTILLARPTHRRGNLHINPKADDFDGFSLSTQATALNHIYTQQLPERIRDLERDVVNGARPYSEWETYLSGSQEGQSRRDYVEGEIRDAMKGTYRYMRDYMSQQLRRGLKSLEKDYFNDLYLDAHPTGSDTISDDDMNTVANRAIAFNRNGHDATKGMRYYGWEAS